MLALFVLATCLTPVSGSQADLNAPENARFDAQRVGLEPIRVVEAFSSQKEER